jgi:hypothetical protein
MIWHFLRDACDDRRTIIHVKLLWSLPVKQRCVSLPLAMLVFGLPSIGQLFAQSPGWQANIASASLDAGAGKVFSSGHADEPKLGRS